MKRTTKLEKVVVRQMLAVSSKTPDLGEIQVAITGTRLILDMNITWCLAFPANEAHVSE